MHWSYIFLALTHWYRQIEDQVLYVMETAVDVLILYAIEIWWL